MNIQAPFPNIIQKDEVKEVNKGYVHQDLKPRNILIDDKDRGLWFLSNLCGDRETIYECNRIISTFEILAISSKVIIIDMVSLVLIIH